MIATTIRRQVLRRIPLSLDYCEPPTIAIAPIESIEPKAPPAPKAAPSEPTAQTTLGMYA